MGARIPDRALLPRSQRAIGGTSRARAGVTRTAVRDVYRHLTFLWQVSGKSFSCERFLAESIERYDKFLRLMGMCGYDQHFFVPPYDVDLCWHTHSEFLQDELDFCSLRD